MSLIEERIPREKFQDMFRPMIRTIGTRNVILRLNELAKLAVPRQTSLDQFMSRLESFCYEQKRPKLTEALEQLFELYLDMRLGEAMEKFGEYSEELNANLDGEKVPEAPEKREGLRRAIEKITALFEESDLAPQEIEAVFRMKAYPEVLAFFLEHRAKTSAGSSPVPPPANPSPAAG